MEDKIIKEVNSIRSIACLCIVLLHSIQFNLNGAANYSLLTLIGLLAFGTPTFVFLSELILSRSHPDRLPNQFFKKRVLPILAPFVSISFLNAFIPNYNNMLHLFKAFAFNLLGNFHGPWFIPVILQFYFLHRVFVKYLSKVSAPLILVGSFVINISYLAIFNLIAAPSKAGFIAFLWEGGYWVPCVGWLFYFSLAYYCGRNYTQFIVKLKDHSYLVLTAPMLAIALILYDNTFHVLPYDSKRMDMVVFTVTMILALFLITSQLQKQPAILIFVSRYSFGVYLLHFFFIRATTKALNALGLNPGYLEAVILFISAVIASITVVHVLNKFPLGNYIVGGIRSTKTIEPYNPVYFRTNPTSL
jgi:membrane-bound acyltransferase YfiQ involved in biofilm formation